MTLADDIRAACASAVTALGESGWQWAKRTSAWDAAPTYATATDITVLATQYSMIVDPDQDDETQYQTVSLRLPEVADMPEIGDKFINAAGVDWIVKQVVSAAYGSRRYQAEQAERHTLGPQRGRIR